jgi:hypothetical protein
MWPDLTAGDDWETPLNQLLATRHGAKALRPDAEQVRFSHPPVPAWLFSR